MDKEMQFKSIIAQYCSVKAEDMTDDMRFREDLMFSSLDFMSFLGELEDTFDIEIDNEDAEKIATVGDAVEQIKNAIN